MSQHEAEILWERAASEAFVDKRYSRAHTWRFDGGMTVPASSSPHAVPAPLSKPENVDPEEAFVAAISSCHMLTFLWLACRAGFVVDAYWDKATGFMKKNDRGRLAVTDVTLHPNIVFSGPKAPTEADVERLHHDAHAECFIANSVQTAIEVKGEWRYRGSPR